MMSGVKSQLGRQSLQIPEICIVKKNQTMAEAENIKEVVNQVGAQVVMVVMMALRDTEAGIQL